ncbi:hypothetical protein GCM10022403_010570 [Streptomyces coacervatus]|uniref:Uncharacterized protein n=1 Tax=Streptomyces coacervatus TaxID=647381 RepID=A0ABP7GWT9_9ACTN
MSQVNSTAAASMIAHQASLALIPFLRAGGGPPVRWTDLMSSAVVAPMDDPFQMRVSRTTCKMARAPLGMHGTGSHSGENQVCCPDFAGMCGPGHPAVQIPPHQPVRPLHQPARDAAERHRADPGRLDGSTTCTHWWTEPLRPVAQQVSDVIGAN